MPTILETAKEETLKYVRDRKPSSFTVGGYVKDGKLIGGVTYDRRWTNGWGLTAFAYAYWNDLPVSVGSRSVSLRAPNVEAGFEINKKLGIAALSLLSRGQTGHGGTRRLQGLLQYVRAKFRGPDAA